MTSQSRVPQKHNSSQAKYASVGLDKTFSTKKG